MMSIILPSVILTSQSAECHSGGDHFAECLSALCYSTEINSAVILMSHCDEHYSAVCHYGESFY